MKRTASIQKSAGSGPDLERRRFLAAAGCAAAGLALPSVADARVRSRPETGVEALYESLSAEQRRAVCFDWDHVAGRRGLLRTRVGANWQITKHEVAGRFYSADQRALVRSIFLGMVDPAWVERFDRQLRDDCGGFGQKQSLAIFGTPGGGPFEFVLTGRHMTLRCDGNSAEHVAFGGPIFYGHAAETHWWSFGLVEKPDHPGNVFWPQALAANGLYAMLDGRQRETALVDGLPPEEAVGFQGRSGRFSGIPIAELSADQRAEAQRILGVLVEPFRSSDRDEVVACLAAQGGLDRCSLAFYSDADAGGDGIWDCFRLEGPAFVWHFRGAPHVHVWVNVASDPGVPLNV